MWPWLRNWGNAVATYWRHQVSPRARSGAAHAWSVAGPAMGQGARRFWSWLWPALIRFAIWGLIVGLVWVSLRVLYYNILFPLLPLIFLAFVFAIMVGGLVGATVTKSAAAAMMGVGRLIGALVGLLVRLLFQSIFWVLTGTWNIPGQQQFPPHYRGGN